MRTKLDPRSLSEDVIFALIDHFNYSITDVNSYNELTDAEKDIISEDTWNKMVE